MGLNKPRYGKGMQTGQQRYEQNANAVSKMFGNVEGYLKKDNRQRASGTYGLHIARQKQKVEKAQIAKERAEVELEARKEERRTEKLRGSIAEVGTTILDGIGSMIGTSKVKRQQQQIDNLAKKNGSLHSEMKR